MAILLDGYFGFRICGAIFGFDRSKSVEYGDKQSHSTLTWLLGIIMTQGVAFAASLQLRGEPFIPIAAYAAVSLLMMVGVSLLLNAKEAPTSNKRRFDHSSLIFGRWVQGALVVLAILSIVASLFGAIPGQRRDRKSYNNDLVQCDIFAADDPKSFGVSFGAGTPQSQLDELSLSRWKSWIGQATLPAGQRILYVQSHPFDSDYLSFQVLIDFDNTNIAFGDAFVALVQNSPPNSITPPVYRLVGLPAVPNDVGVANAKQLPLPMRTNATHLPVFSVPSPNKGDVILLFVIVKPSATEKSLPPRGDERSMFLKLRRVD